MELDDDLECAAEDCEGHRQELFPCSDCGRMFCERHLALLLLCDECLFLSEDVPDVDWDAAPDEEFLDFS